GQPRVPEAEAVLRILVVTHVPLARVTAFVAFAAKNVGKHDFVAKRRRWRGLALRRVLNGLSGEEILNSVLARHAAGEQRGPAGRAGRRADDVVLEAHARLRELVNVGRA